ncbi:C3H1-type domain-containing protein [Trichostrongylus colubriformis]|uniref:C3H1-type domain-containing protein n=1 Tax=Trichostrongylus colubriformis TaxID=6319 RepID=A0AAN8FJV5_TRICO
MTPYPSNYRYEYLDYDGNHCYNHPTSTTRRGLSYSSRRSDVRPYAPSATSPSSMTFSHENDSFLSGIHPFMDQAVSNFANGTSLARRSRFSSSSSSSCSIPQSPSPPKHPQLVKTMLCDFWKRGEVCRFEPHCWFAHGPLQLRTTSDNLSMCSDIPLSSKGSAAGQPMMESDMNHLTPEQQQWMILSQKAHNFLPHIQNITSTRYKDNAKIAAMEISAAGRTCEELEREQTIRRQLRTMGICKPFEHVSSSTTGVDSPQPSGPSTPTFNKDTFQFAFDEYVREKGFSGQTALTSTDSSLYYASYEKEECPLNQYGCCPLEQNCFFEHKGKELM